MNSGYGVHVSFVNVLHTNVSGDDDVTERRSYSGHTTDTVDCL